ncbi:unnamed protein product, partial [Bubo scandiacus]
TSSLNKSRLSVPDGQGLCRELRRHADFPAAPRLLNESSACELWFCFVPTSQSYS